MDRQAVFTKVATHLLTQQERSWGEYMRPNGITEGGMYRTEGEDGETLRCAIGCLIPDELYRPELEGEGVFSMVLQNVLNQAGLIIEAGDESFLSRLQELHDDEDVKDWARCLRWFAQYYHLTMPDVGTDG